MLTPTLSKSSSSEDFQSSLKSSSTSSEKKRNKRRPSIALKYSTSFSDLEEIKITTTPIVSRSGSFDITNNKFSKEIKTPEEESKINDDKKEEEIECKYFVQESPTTIIDGITSSEYNIAKGLITGPLLLVTAPVAGAIKGYDTKDSLEAVKGITTGFTKGLARGVLGSFALIGTGFVTGAVQLKEGIMDTSDAPGQGHNLKENIEHVINTPALNLAFNVEPSNFKEENNFDSNENLKYQFFLTSEPKNVVEGCGQSIYNVTKSFISAATLLSVACIKDTYDGYIDSGYEGAFTSFGGGICRSMFGSVALISAGTLTASTQLFRGFATTENLQASMSALKSVQDDAHHIVKTPIYDMVNGRSSDATTMTKVES